MTLDVYGGGKTSSACGPSPALGKRTGIRHIAYVSGCEFSVAEPETGISINSSQEQPRALLVSSALSPWMTQIKHGE